MKFLSLEIQTKPNTHDKPPPPPHPPTTQRPKTSKTEATDDRRVRH